MQTHAPVLVYTALSIGVVHTLLGPDHYLPFIVLGRAMQWSLPRTALVTFLCGLGHVLSSVLLGIAGAGLGLAVEKLVGVESLRGSLATWALIAFGLVYTIYGIRQAVRNRPHTHRHSHDGQSYHEHEHTHTGEHTHVHAEARFNPTPWALFIVFVLGPCEPLIPIVMYPALQHSWPLMLLVAGAFLLATVGTMLAVVLLGVKGLSLLPLGKLERYGHALAGGFVLASGLAMQFLGL